MCRKATIKDYELFRVHRFIKICSAILNILGILSLLIGLISKFLFNYDNGQYLIFSGLLIFILVFIIFLLKSLTYHQLIVTYQGIKFLGWQFVENNNEMGAIDPILKNNDGMYARVSSLLEVVILSKNKNEVKKHINIEKLKDIDTSGDILDINNLERIFDKNKVSLFHDFYELDEEIYKNSTPKISKFGNFNKLTFENFIPMLKAGLPN